MFANIPLKLKKQFKQIVIKHKHFFICQFFSGWGARHTLVLLGFMALGASYAMRFNLALAIVAMVADHPTKVVNPSSNEPVAAAASCQQHIAKKNGVANSSLETMEEESAKIANILRLDILKGDKLDWTEAEQGIVLGSFFYGYVLTQIPGGLLAQRYSAKWVLGMGILISAIFTIISPITAPWGKEYFIMCRFMEGLAGVSHL